MTVAFPEGKSTVIMGPSGCGKSTLLKVAAGLIPPDAGKILFQGQDIYQISERALRAMRSHEWLRIPGRRALGKQVPVRESRPSPAGLTTPTSERRR